MAKEKKINIIKKIKPLSLTQYIMFIIQTKNRCFY